MNFVFCPAAQKFCRSKSIGVGRGRSGSVEVGLGRSVLGRGQVRAGSGLSIVLSRAFRASKLASG
jgi:hypothetical protein